MIIYQEILQDFQRQKVKYVIVGGIAVNLLGSFRNTADMDILVEMKMKRESGRTIDRADIEELKAIKKLRGKKQW